MLAEALDYKNVCSSQTLSVSLPGTEPIVKKNYYCYSIRKGFVEMESFFYYYYDYFKLNGVPALYFPVNPPCKKKGVFVFFSSTCLCFLT